MMARSHTEKENGSASVLPHPAPAQQTMSAPDETRRVVRLPGALQWDRDMILGIRRQGKAMIMTADSVLTTDRTGISHPQTIGRISPLAATIVAIKAANLKTSIGRTEKGLPREASTGVTIGIDLVPETVDEIDILTKTKGHAPGQEVRAHGTVDLRRGSPGILMTPMMAVTKARRTRVCPFWTASCLA